MQTGLLLTTFFPYRWQKQKYRSEAGRYRIGRMTNQGPGERTENLYNNPDVKLDSPGALFLKDSTLLFSVKAICKRMDTVILQ